MIKNPVILYTDEGFDETLQKLDAEYKRIQNINKELQRQLAEWNKDDEIQKAKEEAKFYETHSLQQLTDLQMRQIEQFKDEHYAACNNKGTYHFVLSGSVFGDIVKIICPVCGTMKDVTDFSTW